MDTFSVSVRPRSVADDGTLVEAGVYGGGGRGRAEEIHPLHSWDRGRGSCCKKRQMVLRKEFLFLLLIGNQKSMLGLQK